MLQIIRRIFGSSRDTLIVGAVAVTIITIVTLGGVRALLIYRLSTEQALLRARFEAADAEIRSHEEAFRRELDAIELTLYTAPNPPAGPVTTNVTPIPGTTRRESGVEQALSAQIRELRDRLSRLEEWRLRMAR